MKKNKIGMKGIVGVSGEFFVAAELSQRGIVATMTLKNTPNIDILATNLEKAKTANIQVKTMSIENNAGWRLSEKDEEFSKIKNHFYVFVNLIGPGKLPEYVIIQKKDLAIFLRNDHKTWMAGMKKDGSPRMDTSMRILDPNRRETCRKFVQKYIDNWDILDLW
ncbi:MAG: hypothetical protein WC662_02000 [Candidatus Paceibacterota bacterium]|jgi:hypothetical protein